MLSLRCSPYLCDRFLTAINLLKATNNSVEKVAPETLGLYSYCHRGHSISNWNHSAFSRHASNCHPAKYRYKNHSKYNLCGWLLSARIPAWNVWTLVRCWIIVEDWFFWMLIAFDCFTAFFSRCVRMATFIRRFSCIITTTVGDKFRGVFTHVNYHHDQHSAHFLVQWHRRKRFRLISSTYMVQWRCEDKNCSCPLRWLMAAFQRYLSQLKWCGQ